jgi:hypothetical protein
LELGKEAKGIRDDFLVTNILHVQSDPSPKEELGEWMMDIIEFLTHGLPTS